MKLTSKLLTATALLVSGQLASAATYDIVITGSTAARATTMDTLKNNTFSSAPAYIWQGDASISKSTKALFKGSIGADTYRVMCTWSGSGTGIQTVAAQSAISVIDPATTIVSNARNDAAATTTATPQFAMSDVFQASTAYTTPTLSDNNAFVLEFMFITNPGGNTAGITNMTPQLMNKLYKEPSGIPLSYITGNAADTDLVFGTGRDAGSGTRITALAETGYGVSNAVQNWRLKDSGGAIIGMMQWPSVNTGFTSKEALSANIALGNGGYNSGGEVARLLALPSTNPGIYDSSDSGWATNLGDLGQVRLISYVGVSDKLAANEALSYCGASYSSDNIRNGKYTFWSYAHFYAKPSLLGYETTFKTNFLGGIPSNLTTGSISASGMNVTRVADGSSVL